MSGVLGDFLFEILNVFRVGILFFFSRASPCTHGWKKMSQAKNGRFWPPSRGGGGREKTKQELGLLLFICQIVPSRFKGLYVVLCKVYNQTRILKKVLTIFWPDFSVERVVFFYLFFLRYLRLPFTFPMNPSLLSSTLVYPNDFTPITIQTNGTEEVHIFAYGYEVTHY